MSDETPPPVSDTQTELAAIRSERKALENLKVTLGQPRREGATCGAKTAAGNPCRRSPILGGTKCTLHGGASPLARQEAERRLLIGVSFALDRLVDAVTEHDHEPCALCGCDPSKADPTVLRAAIALLDRSGFGPGVRLQHSQEDEQGIREIRVNIVEPDPEQRAADEESDREVAAMRRAERQANSVTSQELELELELERKDTSLVFDLGVSE